MAVEPPASSLRAVCVFCGSSTPPDPAYHAAAVLAAGGVVALLDAIVELGRVAGLDEQASITETP